MPGLVYAFVARDGTVLAEYAALSGNFRAVACECLSNSQIVDERFTVTADAYTFNYLRSAGYTFLCVADEAYGRQIPFACLERLRDAFLEKYAERGRGAGEDSLNNAFSPAMKREMDYCMEHPEEISKMASVQRKVDEVKGIMMQNVEQVLVRGERLDVLVDRTDDLRDQAQRFQRQGTQLRKKMWWQSFRMKLIVAGAVVLLALVIFLLACFTGPKHCIGGGGRGNQPAPSPGSAGANTAPGVPAGDSALVPGSPNSLAPAAGAVPAPGVPGGDSALVPGGASAASAPAAAGAVPAPGVPGGDSALVPGGASAASAPTAAGAVPAPGVPGGDSALVPGGASAAPAPAAAGAVPAPGVPGGDSALVPATPQG